MEMQQIIEQAEQNIRQALKDYGIPDPGCASEFHLSPVRQAAHPRQEIC